MPAVALSDLSEDRTSSDFPPGGPTADSALRTGTRGAHPRPGPSPPASATAEKTGASDRCVLLADRDGEIGASAPEPHAKVVLGVADCLRGRWLTDRKDAQ